jgi:hypothetical protein
MVKNAKLMIGATLVVILVLILIAAVVVYNKAPPTTGVVSVQASPHANTSTVNTSNVSGITALQAVSIASSSIDINNWKTGQTNVTLSRLYSSLCSDGLSPAWTAIYDSDHEEIMTKVNSNGTTILSTVQRTPDMAHAQNILISGLIDSDKASDIASTAVSGTNMQITGPLTIELVPSGTGAYMWDISYPVDNGIYIVRVDASSGKVTQSTHANI